MMRKRSTNRHQQTDAGHRRQCAPLNTGGMRLNLKTAENLKVGLNLNEQLLHAFCHQVSSTQKAEWTSHTLSATPKCKCRSVNRRCIKIRRPTNGTIAQNGSRPTFHATFN